MPLLTINRYLSNIPNRMYQYFNYEINRIIVTNEIELRLQLLSLNMTDLNISMLYLSNDCINSIFTCI